MRPQLIEEARRHQRRRRKIVGTVLIAPLAVGGLVVGVVFVDAGGQGKVVAHSATSHSKESASPAPPRKLPTALSPSNVVVLNPATGDVIVATPLERAAAALQAVQNAAAAQEAAQAADAQAQAAAAAAATQSTHR